MKKYTNRILAGLWLAGVAMTVITMVIIRFRLDRIIEQAI